MKKTKWLPVIVSLVCLAGCAAKPVEKDWIAVGGSRSDATIRLGYTYNPKIEVPQLPWSGPYCAQMNAVAEFQCIGAPATGRPVSVKK